LKARDNLPAAGADGKTRRPARLATAVQARLRGGRGIEL